MPNETMNTISTADATIQFTAQETNQTTPTTDNTGSCAKDRTAIEHAGAFGLRRLRRFYSEQ